jgi:hypothetical protein
MATGAPLVWLLESFSAGVIFEIQATDFDMRYVIALLESFHF